MYVTNPFFVATEASKLIVLQALPMFGVPHVYVALFAVAEVVSTILNEVNEQLLEDALKPDFGTTIDDVGLLMVLKDTVLNGDNEGPE